MKIIFIVLSAFVCSWNAFAAKVLVETNEEYVRVEISDMAPSDLKEIITKYEIEVDSAFFENLIFENEFVSVTFTIYGHEIKTPNKQDPGDGRDQDRDRCRVEIGVRDRGSNTEVTVNGNARIVRAAAGVKHSRPSRDVTIKVEGSSSDCRYAVDSTLDRAFGRDR